MPTTRSSARKGGAASPAPSSSPPSRSGSKRKADSSAASSPAAKSKASPAPKKQKTIEETLPEVNGQKPSDAPSEETKAKNEDDAALAKKSDAPTDVEMKDAGNEEADGGQPQPNTDNKIDDSKKSEPQSQTKTGENSTALNTDSSKTQTNGQHKDDPSESTKTGTITTNGTNKDQQTAASTSNTVVEENKQTEEAKPSEASASSAPKLNSSTDANPQQSESSAERSGTSTEAKPADGDAVEHSSQREKSTPSSILEKGIIYFFFRGRVGIDDPSDVNDIARSYIVLRPLPRGAKLTDGTIGDQNNLRVLALPKKVLPKGPNDRFMVFVEKSKANLEDLKKDFLSGSDYETKTAGTRHTPAATPIGEGVYALTSTGRESHLAYVLTIPKELSEVQKDMGLETKGSWVTSVKNPQHAGPAQAQLPNDPKFPQEILDEFRSLRWGQLQPKHLDYENCQLLVIGHKDHSFAKGTEIEGDKTDPKEELEKLGEEDERRVEHLEGDDTVFEDLNIDAKEYPGVQTTW